MANLVVLPFNPDLKEELERAQDEFLSQGLSYKAAFLRVGHVVSKMNSDVVQVEGGTKKWFEAAGYKNWKQFCLIILEPEYKISEERSYQLIAAWERSGEVSAYVLTQKELSFLSERRARRIESALQSETTFRAVHGLSPEDAVSVIVEAQNATGKDVPTYAEIKSARQSRLGTEERVAIAGRAAERDFDEAMRAVNKLTVVYKLLVYEKLFGELINGS